MRARILTDEPIVAEKLMKELHAAEDGWIKTVKITVPADDERQEIDPGQR
jgi:hypothetical protein